MNEQARADNNPYLFDSGSLWAMQKFFQLQTSPVWAAIEKTRG